MVFGCNLSMVNSLECISINNQQCKVRPETINVNSNEPIFYPFSIKISKGRVSCNNINDAKLCKIMQNFVLCKIMRSRRG